MAKTTIQTLSAFPPAKASQNEYFHQDFHHSLSRCIHYVGQKFGEAEVRSLLEQYAKSVLGRLITEIRQQGLAPLKESILSSYEKEKHRKRWS